MYADAKFGGSLGKSTSGIQLNIEGPNSCFPVEACSSVQQAVSHSTPEAEIVAGDIALRKIGHAAMVFWEKIKHRFVSSLPGGSSMWTTKPQEEQDVPACGATAAQKRARKEEGIQRREDRVRQERGEK